MIYLKTDEEIELMRESNLLVGMTLGEMAKWIAPGITTLKLDKIAEEFIRDHGAQPGFLGYGGFPNTLCISVNEVIVHGDSAYTFCVGEVVPEIRQLLKTTKESLYLGIEHAVEGKRIGDIGHAVQTYCEARGYSVVRELCGHGIGKKLHEEPNVPNYGRPGTGPLLKNGMCIAIEPMINMGSRNIVIERDGWTTRTRDRKPAAHFEHTIAIKGGKADILSSFEYVEQVLGEKSI